MRAAGRCNFPPSFPAHINNAFARTRFFRTLFNPADVFPAVTRESGAALVTLILQREPWHLLARLSACRWCFHGKSGPKILSANRTLRWEPSPFSEDANLRHGAFAVVNDAREKESEGGEGGGRARRRLIDATATIYGSQDRDKKRLHCWWHWCFSRALDTSITSWCCDICTVIAILCGAKRIKGHSI